MSDEQQPPPVGSVAEEAAALFQALSGLARQQGGQYAAAASDAADAAARAAHDVNAHIATGSQECTWCPVCQVIHVVRSTSPEVKAQLMVAAQALVQAAAGALGTDVPDSSGAPVEKIDLDGEGEWEDQ